MPVQARLLKTKFFKPQPTSDFVTRNLIESKLKKIKTVPILLVSASTGYGKSTIIADFLNREEKRHAWLSLSEQENEFQRFINYFISAIQTKIPQFGTEILDLVLATVPPSVIELAELVVNEIADFEEYFLLALDDYHHIRDKDIHQFLAKLFEYPQPFFRLIIITRRDPVLPLSDWRNKNILVEIRSSDLKFNRDEILEFYDKSISYHPDDDVLSKLVEATDGWISGLRLLTLSANNNEELGQHFSNFKYKNSRVISELVDGVLNNQPESTREILLKLSILKEFNIDLFSELCLKEDEKGNKEVLFKEFIFNITSSNMFIIALDDKHNWYRFHHLFIEHLNKILVDRYENKRIDVLRLNAAKCYRENNLLEDSLHYFVAANQLDSALDVFSDYRIKLLSASKYFEMENILKLFPQNFVETKAVLLLAKAWVYFHNANFIPMVALLDPIEQILKNEKHSKYDADLILGETYALKALDLYQLHVDLNACLKYSEKSISLLQNKSPHALGLAWVFYTGAMQLLKNSSEARHKINIELEQCSEPALKYHLLLMLCIIDWFEGDLRNLVNTANFLLDFGKEAKLNVAIASGNAYLGLAHYYLNNKGAIDYFQEAVRLRHFPIVALSFPTSTILAYLHAELGNQTEQGRIIQVCEKWAFQLGGKRNKKHIESTIADINWSINRDASGLAWAKENDYTDYMPLATLIIPEITQAKILALDDDRSSWLLSLKILDQMIPFLEQRNNINFLIRSYIIKALVNSKLGNEDVSYDALKLALDLSEPRHFIRPYLQLGESMKNLLLAYKKTAKNQVRVDEILQYFSKPKNHNGDVVLSNREKEILVLAEKMTNKEVGNQLFISEKTVKTHITNINKKLKVMSKIEALKKAKELDLI